MNRIMYNTSIISNQPTGIGVYTANLLAKIKQLETKSKFEVQEVNKSNSKMGSLYRMFWNIFILPWSTDRNILVFSFSHHGSPFLKNQIITIHDLICLSFPKQHPIQYIYFKYIIPSIIKSCLKIVTISEFTKSEIIRHYKVPEGKIVVIKNGVSYSGITFNVEADKELLELTAGKPYSICVGGSYGHKNIHRLIEAINLANTQHLFIIISKNTEYFKTVRIKILKLKLTNVVLLNYVSDALLSALYKNAVCNIYLSLYEGFGFPPLEAASFNTISLVSCIPVLTEIYGETVIYTDPYNTEDIAKKIKIIINGEINLLPLRQKFPLLLSSYTWDKTASETIKLIHSYIS